jgi:demethylmenaquinone methyltransferase/2-methoxy-6-polyprenyl-1,4-benzoquinol methylase
MSAGARQPGLAGPDPERVRGMFGAIARRYDLMNSLMTAGMHRRWRRLGVEAAAVFPGDSVLDVCCGTGDFAFELEKRTGPGGRVVAVDFSRPMLDVAREKSRERGAPVDFRWGDATALEFEDGSFDAVTVGFGVRNIPDLGKAFSEMARVTRPGGRVVCLEITSPTRWPFNRFFGIWFDRVVPALGRVVSRDRSAYSYLPASVRRFPPADRLAQVMAEAGLSDVSYRLMAGSIIALHRGTA